MSNDGNYGRTKSLILILSLCQKHRRIKVRWLPHPGQICLQTFGSYFLVQMSISKNLPWPPYIIVFYCFVKLEFFQNRQEHKLKILFSSNLKPDITIINKQDKTISIFELTVPSEQRIEAANKLKIEKYQHFLSDISSLQPNLKCFEIGSHTGYISPRNKRYLVDLHKYCKKGIKLKNFLQNISSIAILSSYYLFNCRNQEVWEDMDVILPPFSNQ